MGVVVGFSDKASKGLKNVGGQFSRTSKSITGNITGLMGKIGLLTGVGGVAGVVLSVGKAVSTFSSFDKAVTNAASVTGATGKVFEDTKKHIAAVSKELGESTVFSAGQSATAFYDLSSAGYDVANMTKNDLQPILDLASGTQTDLTHTTEVVTSSLAQFGLGIEDSSRVADVFSRVIGSTKADIDKLELSMSYVGPVAHSLGISFEETNAILGRMYMSGYKGEKAGNALKNAFSTLLNPVGQAKEVITEFGLDLDKLNPQTNSFADVLDYLKDKGFGTSEMFRLFGSEAAPAITSILSQGDDIRNLTDDLMNSSGASATMASEQLDNFSGSISLFKSALEGIAITIGSKVAPYIRALIDRVTKAIPPTMELAGQVKDALMPAFESIKSIVGSLITIFNNLTGGMTSNVDVFKTSTSAIFSLIDVFAALSDAIATVLSWFAKHKDITLFISVLGGVALAAVGIPILLAAISAGFAALAASAATAAVAVIAATAPISLPIIAIGAAIALLAVAWRNNWFDIQGVVSNALSTISGVIDFFVDYVKTAISVFLDLITLNWSDAWNSISAFITKWGGDTATAVENIGKDLITALINGISGALSGVWDIITGEKSVTSTIIGGLNSILPGAKAQGNDVSTTFSAGINDKMSDVGDAAKSVADTIHTKLGEAPPAAKTTGQNAMIDMALGITDKMSDVITAAGTTKDDIHTELEKAPPAATTTGYDTAIGMADGITSGKSKVSEAAASVVDAAKTEMDRLWATKQSDEYRKSLYVTEPAEDTPTIPAGTITKIWSYDAGWGQDAEGNWGYQKGWATNQISSGGDWEVGQYETGPLINVIYGKHVLQSVWDTMTAQQQQDLKDSHGGVVDDTTYEVTQQFAKGGYVPHDMNADIHRGEYVIPARGAPVLSGGKDINLNITYNMGDIIGIDDLQSILGQHDQKLLSKLQSLI